MVMVCEFGKHHIFIVEVELAIDCTTRQLLHILLLFICSILIHLGL